MSSAASFDSRPCHAVVTGATGFLGSTLLKELIAAGHSVTAVRRRPLDGQDHSGLASHARLRWVVTDIMNPDSLKSAFSVQILSFIVPRRRTRQAICLSLILKLLCHWCPPFMSWKQRWRQVLRKLCSRPPAVRFTGNRCGRGLRHRRWHRRRPIPSLSMPVSNCCFQPQ